MVDRIARLRLWLLGSAVFLILVITAFIGSARYVRHRLKRALTAKLGANVVSDANGWTYSPSRGSQTLYTVHAAKWEQHADGKIALHDVSILLYGKKGDRNDRIYGDQFEYDRNAGVVRAQGLVHIDIQSAPVAGQRPPANALHVTTSNLVYLEKLGVAATSEYIEFQSGGITGHATGADYASDTGVLMLHSAVSMEGVTGGRPVNLTAATAELEDQEREILLTGAKYDSLGRTAEAEQATLHTRPDGTLSRVEAQGNVTAMENGATVVSQRADVVLNAASVPQSAVMTGGVKYLLDQPLRQVRGEADEATVAFAAEKKAQPQHAVFTGAVHMTEKVRATEAPREPWSTRDLTAVKVDVVLAPAGPGKAQLEDAEATGNPRLTLVNNGSLASSRGEGTTEIAADDLKAHMIPANDAKQPPQLDTIAGRGHTVLHQVSADGAEQASTGDTLDAKFRPMPSGNARVATGNTKASQTEFGVGQRAADILASAVQQGHVTVMQRKPARPGGKGPDEQHAVAARAAYDGDQDRMVLSGGVQVMDTGSTLWANQVALDHKTGDSHAMGAVKVDYVDNSMQHPTHGKGAVMNGVPGRTGGAAEPNHILADRADMERATDVATFEGRPVRLWQGGSQVQAPVIELDRVEKRMIARGEAATGWSSTAQVAQVHTVLVSEGGGGAGAAASGGARQASTTAGCGKVGAKSGAGGSAAGAQAANVVRIASGGLVYSDIFRRADFTGGFRADTAEGMIRADAGTAYLDAANPPHDDGKTVRNGVAGGTAANEAGALPSLDGHLERVVATGHVDIQEPGVHATGERLVYTAADQVSLLTGNPRAISAQGITTGAALRMHNSCDDSGGVSVEALSAVPGELAHPVETDTRVSNDERVSKGKR